ncbi:hypothetical protein BT96DRAFT_1013966 [Gymnopus androsaceus JB14]|uniref:Uncharacterized protein n=1 Tax=Gymnopus androsaceus JB14 TaxID=1447944 RepID=A0A6A4IAT0_9AGAR|nr:hypothetical protein BT96DRAFT_1013966 [Gymnopus androsaceus JB14]
MSLLSDAESDSEFRLTINEHYAQSFQYKKEREELEHVKLKYGSDAEEVDSESDSEEDESEDEDGEELTPAVDAAIVVVSARLHTQKFEQDGDKWRLPASAPAPTPVSFNPAEIGGHIEKVLKSLGPSTREEIFAEMTQRWPCYPMEVADHGS